MLHVALWEPEIPPNTGNVARLCAATGTTLHLIGRLGFRTDDRSLKRAGLDYWPHVSVEKHVSIEDFEKALADVAPHTQPLPPLGRGEPGIWLVDNPAPMAYTRATFHDGDVLLFGNESKGLPPGPREKYATRLIGIPMPGGTVRSLNLATAVGVVLYEALRQIHDW
jgi:tRNA (cytidine/uridine-2'-O-)-methyltransferase